MAELKERGLKDRGDWIIKARATRLEKQRTFNNMKAPQDIYVTCSTGLWVKRLIQLPDRFWWGKWEKC